MWEDVSGKERVCQEDLYAGGGGEYGVWALEGGNAFRSLASDKEVEKTETVAVEEYIRRVDGSYDEVTVGMNLGGIDDFDSMQCA